MGTVSLCLGPCGGARGGGGVLMSEVPPKGPTVGLVFCAYEHPASGGSEGNLDRVEGTVQGYLAHTKALSSRTPQ